jgi:hyperosmotically inducible protein
MKALILGAMLVAGGTCGSMAMADSPTDSDTSHPGTFVKDSVITTKVKAQLAAKHLATLTDIQVDTDDAGVVWLRGKAPTKDASDLAELITKDTDGVRSVHNRIVVQN